MNDQGRFDWESLVSAWLVSAQREDENRWAMAAVAKIVAEKFGMEGIRQFAAEVGVSARQVHRHRQTFEAFSDPESRVATLTFEHHFLASCGESPSDWIELAASKNMSIRQLREAILRAEAHRQVPPPGTYVFGRREEFEANDMAVAIIGEQVERLIVSKHQWVELIRLLSFLARSQRWLDEATVEAAKKAIEHAPSPAGGRGLG